MLIFFFFLREASRRSTELEVVMPWQGGGGAVRNPDVAGCWLAAADD
jgi:hypothetical protein